VSVVLAFAGAVIVFAQSQTASTKGDNGFQVFRFSDRFTATDADLCRH
jgi:hypothetical protein